MVSELAKAKKRLKITNRKLRAATAKRKRLAKKLKIKS